MQRARSRSGWLTFETQPSVSCGGVLPCWDGDSKADVMCETQPGDGPSVFVKAHDTAQRVFESVFETNTDFAAGDWEEPTTACRV